VNLYIKYIEDNGKDPKELAEDYFKLEQKHRKLILTMEDKESVFQQ